MSVPNDENQDDMCSFLHAGTKTRTGAEFSAESHMYSSWATTPDSAFGDDDTANLSPKQFLLISSPSLGKIVWTSLDNFQSAEGRTFALISTGLSRPKGIAVDKKTGHLYVADQGASAIYRYEIVIDSQSSEASVGTTGLRMSILEGYPVEWVAVDDESNLYFTSTDKNTINKIDKVVIDKIVSQEFRLDAYTYVPEKTLEAEAAVRNAFLATRNKSLPDDGPAIKPKVLQLYDSDGNSHVSSPEAIWVDGNDLYWSNSQDGKNRGTILRGSIDPAKSVNGSAGRTSFPIYSVTNSSINAFGFARVGHVLYFSTCQTDTQDCKVNGLLLSTGDVLEAANSLSAPRGLAWDGDETVYVADEEGGMIWSFPSGRFMQHVPISKTVAMQGAFGLIIVSEADPCFAQATYDAGTLERIQTMSGVAAAAKNSAFGQLRGHGAIFLAIVAAGYSHVIAA